MILLPAMDLYEGKVVRLLRGDYAKMKVYSDEPVKAAKEISKAGASWLHVVDLEGAKTGKTPNFHVIKKIKEETGLLIEAGGGLRSMEEISRFLDAGIDRVILGTRAVTDRAFLKEALETYGARIAVGADLKDGKLAVRGWKEVASEPADAFFADLCQLGVKTVICTDISKDGMLGGTNLALYQRLAKEYPLDLIASGGVSSLEDIHALRAIPVSGAILGKAMYDGKLSLKDALLAAEGTKDAEKKLEQNQKADTRPADAACQKAGKEPT